MQGKAAPPCWRRHCRTLFFLLLLTYVVVAVLYLAPSFGFGGALPKKGREVRRLVDKDANSGVGAPPTLSEKKRPSDGEVLAHVLDKVEVVEQSSGETSSSSDRQPQTEENKHLRNVEEKVDGKANAEEAIPSPPPTAKQLPPKLCYNVHAFYYPWYGSPDGEEKKWVHWNHPYLPHWEKSITDKYPKGRHQPPDDIGASFYPLLGPYSSSSEEVIRKHMQFCVAARIGTIVISWYPPEKADGNGIPSDGLVRPIMNIANEFGVKVAFHSEPYDGRTHQTLLNDIHYIIDTYGRHPALLKMKPTAGDRELPVIYVYDAYHVPPEKWGSLFDRKLPSTMLRNTKYDVFAIALGIERHDLGKYIEEAGFDGVYSYFASNTFTHMSRWENWPHLSEGTEERKAVFVPSVGPGYDDLRVRPWNQANLKRRQNGAYYNQSWEAAITSLRPGLQIVSITSFNEWHEGTQIEPASTDERWISAGYSSYSPGAPELYLQLTRHWIEKFCFSSP